MPSSLLTVIIPGFNRIGPLRYTLRSVANAAARLRAPVEVLLVDDGSEPSLEQQLAGFDAGMAVTHLRQRNQGSIVARLTGLSAACGEYVHFIDSDDIVHPDKYSAHINTLKTSGADVSYDDQATATLGPDYSITQFSEAAKLPATDDPAELYLRIQPSPHGPVYRRSYLQAAITQPVVSAHRAMDPAGDVWLFYNLCIHPARIAKVEGFFTAAGPHEENRYSLQWEKLAVASLLIMEAFQRACPVSPATLTGRKTTGEMAFRAWRNLPKNFHPDFSRRMLALWKRAPHGPNNRLGTDQFSKLAAFMGPVAAAHLLRLWRARPYDSVRTLSPETYKRLFDDLATIPSSHPTARS